MRDELKGTAKLALETIQEKMAARVRRGEPLALEEAVLSATELNKARTQLSGNLDCSSLRGRAPAPGTT